MSTHVVRFGARVLAVGREDELVEHQLLGSRVAAGGAPLGGCAAVRTCDPLV